MRLVARGLAAIAVTSLTGVAGLATGTPAATAWDSRGSDGAARHDSSATFDRDPSSTVGPNRFAVARPRSVRDRRGPSDSPVTLFVSGRGHDTGSCGQRWSPCRTIGRGVANATSGTTVVVLPGRYAEMVTVDKRLSLRGVHASIDATGRDNGILLHGPGASGSTVSGFTVENAIGEGILASGVDEVEISWNRLDHNDQGVSVPNSYGQCQAQGEIPGDCGEGLHLQATTNSRVVANDVNQNAGGILVSDDFAPTYNNLIAFNRVTDNKPDCGITVPAHDPAAGVYDNTITMNWVTGNGEGGVLIAAGVPGSAAHDNRVTRNYLADNGFAGVTLHAHAPGQDLDGNVIDSNVIRTNNVRGDDDAGVTATTGILIFSGDPSVSINGTLIRHNLIVDNHFGIWLSPGLVSTAGIGGNSFVHIDVPVQQ